MQRRAIIAALGAAALARPALAQGAPTEIRIIVPFAAGGGTDLLARRLQPLLEARGHKLVVENLTGGGSMVGMSRLAQSRPDGRTLGLASQGLIAQIAANEIPLRLEQFTPLVRVAVDPLVVVTGARSRFRTAQDVLSALRTSPGPSVGAAGPQGTVGHLRTLGLTQEVRGEMTYIGYNGASRVAHELAGGHLDLGVVKPNDVFGQIRSGELRVLIVLEDSRIRQMPEVPSLADLGLNPHPFGRMSLLTFVTAPAGLPPALQQVLTTLLREAVLSPEYQAKAEEDAYIADALSGPPLVEAISQTFQAIRNAQAKVPG
jgi:tripartite-type tricarboxylate transporter receptor subunit TctC